MIIVIDKLFKKNKNLYLDYLKIQFKHIIFAQKK